MLETKDGIKDLWPSQGQTASRSWKYFRSLLPAMQIFRLTHATLFHLFAMAVLWPEPHERAKEFGLAVANTMIITKLAVLVRRKERIAKIFDAFEELNGELGFVDAQCENVRVTAEERCRKLSKFFLAFFLTIQMVLVTVTLPELVENVFLPFDLWFGEKTLGYYFLIGITIPMLTMSGVDMFTLVLMDVTLLVIVIQAISQFNILRYKLENMRAIVESQLQRNCHTPSSESRHDQPIGQRLRSGNVCIRPVCAEVSPGTVLHEENERSSEASDETDECSGRREAKSQDELSLEMEKYLKNCVRHHESLMRCCSETQVNFSPATAYQIVMTALLALIALFISIFVNKVGGEFDVLLVAAVFFTAGTSEFFLMCVFCDKLTERSALIREAAYACDWLEATEGFKLSLRIIISRSSRPVILKAFGIPLSLPTFRTAMRAVYYVYTMALNIMNGKKIIALRL